LRATKTRVAASFRGDVGIKLQACRARAKTPPSFRCAYLDAHAMALCANATARSCHMFKRAYGVYARLGDAATWLAGR